MSAKKGTLFGYFKKVDSPTSSPSNNRTKLDFGDAENESPAGQPETPKRPNKVKAESNVTPLSAKRQTTKLEPKSSAKKTKVKKDKDDEKKRVPAKSPKSKPKPKKARIEDDEEDEEPPSSEEEDVDSGDDYVPKDTHESSDDAESVVSEHSDDEPEPMSDDEPPTPEAKTPRRSRKAPLSPSTPKATPRPKQESSTWTHLTYEFLKNPKDSKRRTASDPEYDPTTIYVPEDFKQKLTPGMRQWWDLKSAHFDTILFFKVGKFYELYHMDAVVGVEELGFTFMRGEWAHSGFPEVALQKNMEALLQKGYKCARVEQTETPKMMEDRCRKASKVTKFDKVVKREICNISSKGLQICGSEIMAGSTYIMAMKKRGRRIGVCLLDSTVGRFHIGEFEDDHQLSSIRTIVSRFSPVEAIVERSIERDVVLIIESVGAKVEQPSSKNLPTPEKGLAVIREKGFFKDKEYPAALREIIAEDDPLLLTARRSCELAAGALSIIIKRLEEALVIDDVFTIGDFESISIKQENGQDAMLPKVMILDSVALTNLEIFQNSSGTMEGSLLKTIDFTSTPFGLRQLKKWLLSPSCIADEIEARYDAVGELMDDPDDLKTMRNSLRKLPDMDKMLARVHSLSLKKDDHPDSRAIMYSNDVYSKRKIEDFCRILDGFKDALALIRGRHPKSAILKELTTLECDGGKFPDLGESLKYFERAFDRREALKAGKIIPTKGVDCEYDESERAIAEVQSELDKYLKSQFEHFGTKVSFTGSGRTAYQIEVPQSHCHKITSDHQIQGTKKGSKRYYTDEGRELCSKMLQAEEARDVASKDIMRRIFASFDEKREMWRKAIDCLSELDCLVSMALYGVNSGGTVCRPVIVRDAPKAMMKIVNGSHPCLLKRLGQDKLIANDFSLGIVDEGKCDGSSVALLTGPNMGGKSTLMKQVGLLTILAQLGAWVPAESMEFSLVDRVFTRLGATDHITLGESTFLVELLETSLVFKHSTQNSLVLLDELGRGTSTNDGAAIAHSVLKNLAKSDRRTLFSTHYHDLAADVEGVYLGHMACIVDSDVDVVFLYKFVPGHCEKSFGFNVARLAGIDPEIIDEARRISEQMETQNKLLEKFFRYMSISSPA